MSNTSEDAQLDLLKRALPEDVRFICERLHQAGQTGWAVGGSVRDVIRGAPASDWDVATDALPEKVVTLFKRVIPTGLKHGTVTVLLKGQAYEVTTLRGEGAYQDGRRPEKIHFLDDIVEDLARRDFTVNAIAYQPLSGTLVDPFGGRDDLKNQLMRAVGVPLERFTEDGLRVMRAARFAATLGCDIEAQTLLAMADPRVIDTLSRVSVERILQEWLKAMKADQPSVAFSIMREAGMLQACCPSLAAITEIRWRDTMQLLDRCPDDPALRFAALLHATKQPQSVTKALKMSNEMRAGISAIIDPQPLQYAPTWSDADLRRFLRSVSQNDLPRILTLSTLMAELGLEQGNAHVSELSSRIDEERKRATPLSTKQLAINGGTLIQTLQLKPGRIVGQLLEALLERVTDDPELNTRDALLNEARRIASERDL